jgi:hypothetical protein
LETLDSKVKLEGPSKSPRESPPPSQDAGRPFKSRGGWRRWGWRKKLNT